MPADAVVVRSRFPATPASLDDVHAALDELWASVEVAAADRHLFATAVAEIGANVLTHAGDGAEVDLALVADGASLVATFDDDGAPADPTILEAEMPEDDATSGRGLPMARAATHELRYERAHGRNRWTLVRRLDAGA